VLKLNFLTRVEKFYHLRMNEFENL
jgi:hypothetical protein